MYTQFMMHGQKNIKLYLTEFYSGDIIKKRLAGRVAHRQQSC